MWSTSLSCLYSLDALNAKKRCVYLQWTKYVRYYAFITTFILLFELSSAQNISARAYITAYKGVSSKAIELISQDVMIRPFYNEHGNMKLNITLMSLTGSKVEEYNISLHRNGPPEFHICSSSSEYYKILNNNTNIIIPSTEIQSTFLASRCNYTIKIIPIPSNENEVIETSLVVPGTSIVSNIKAFAFYDELNNVSKLNVTWDIPTEGLLPIEYHIKISPLREDKDHCTTAKIMETYKTSKLGYAIVDEEVMPGCMYTIEVIEQPTNDDDPPKINYTIPDCVGKRCMCHFQKEIPPPPSITVKQISEDKIRVFWKIPKLVMKNLTMIKFRVALSQHPSIVLHTRNISDQEVETEIEENITVPGMLSGALYNIHVFYINASYCESKQAFLSYHGKNFSEQHVAYNIMMSSMFILIFIIILCLLWKRRFSLCFSIRWICYRLRGQHLPAPPQIRRIYRPTVDGERTRPYFSVPMEYNNLYIEKEIAEEIERGKVDKYEVSYTRLKFGPEIGNGAFGQVFLARATAIARGQGHTTVAVKKLKKTASSEELEEFLLEISMLKQIGQHPNIVTLLGCCTLRQPYCMIMEYVPCGDLLQYLRTLRLQYEQKGKAFLFTVNKNFEMSGSPSLNKQKVSDASYITPESIPSSRLPSVTETEYTVLGSEMEVPTTPEAITPRTPVVLECVLDPRELQSFAIQIARGMQHLERKQIVHRDLAARNILIDENKTLKISDFGLSRSGIYVNSKHKKVPLRWLSVEAIRDHLYTSKSDVWAYGIVLWEISTLGGFPYPTIGNDEILKFLLKGKRLEKPENCTEELYEMMLQCWSHAEDRRPSFTELVEYLEALSSKRRVYVDFNQLNPSYIFPPTEEQTLAQIKTEDNIQTIEIVLPDKDK